MNRYDEMCKKHQSEIGAFPLFWAFSNEQFAEGMAKLGLTKKDTDKIVGFYGGGYIRKTDVDKFNAMLDGHKDERNAAIIADTTGLGFIKEMFRSEMANHEYGYSRDTDDVLDALDLNWAYLESHPAMMAGWEAAENEILAGAAA
jgi:hypothetical protein